MALADGTEAVTGFDESASFLEYENMEFHSSLEAVRHRGPDYVFLRFFFVLPSAFLSGFGRTAVHVSAFVCAAGSPQDTAFQSFLAALYDVVICIEAWQCSGRGRFISPQKHCPGTTVTTGGKNGGGIISLFGCVHDIISLGYL